MGSGEMEMQMEMEMEVVRDLLLEVMAIRTGKEQHRDGEELHLLLWLQPGRLARRSAQSRQDSATLLPSGMARTRRNNLPASSTAPAVGDHVCVASSTTNYVSTSIRELRTTSHRWPSSARRFGCHTPLFPPSNSVHH